MAKESGHITSLEISFSHAAAAISLLGALLNLLFIRTLLKHRATLLTWSTSYIGVTVFILSIVSVFHGSLMAAECELWTASSTGSIGLLDNPTLSSALAGMGYCLLAFVFTCNFMLALERYWTIKYSEKLPQAAVIALITTCGSMCCIFIIAFSLTPSTSWDYLPMGKPVDMDNSPLPWHHISNMLLLLGQLVFVAEVIGICVVYENTYFNIAALYEMSHDTNEEEARERCQAEVQVQRSILLRCIFMSIGIVVFYVPNLVLVTVAIVRPFFFSEHLSELSYSWMVCMTTIIPAFDPLWTPVLILMFQENFGTAFVKDYSCIFRHLGGRRDDEKTRTAVEGVQLDSVLGKD
ncbi:hypothetical protein HDU77_006912 [Chytriomyces hyalinus]|nr:hypothetical protein HDU77_006912 [Chytriomyces hyalinus]